MSLSLFTEPYYSLADFDNLFDEALNARSAALAPVATRGERQWTSRPVRPRMDLHEDRDKNMMTAIFELPGLTKEDVQMDIKDNALTLSGEWSPPKDLDEKGYTVHERRRGKFFRSLPLPSGIKPEDIKAKMNNGVLCVMYPRTTPEMEPRRIDIK